MPLIQRRYVLQLMFNHGNSQVQSSADLTKTYISYSDLYYYKSGMSIEKQEMAYTLRASSSSLVQGKFLLRRPGLCRRSLQTYVPNLSEPLSFEYPRCLRHTSFKDVNDPKLQSGQMTMIELTNSKRDDRLQMTMLQRKITHEILEVCNISV